MPVLALASAASARPKPAPDRTRNTGKRLIRLNDEFVDQRTQFIARRQAEQRDTLRLKPSLDKLHTTILGWSPLLIGTTIKEQIQKTLKPIPPTFSGVEEYHTIFYPLLIEECRGTIESALEESKTDAAAAVTSRAFDDSARTARSRKRKDDGGSGSVDADPEFLEIKSVTKIDEFLLVDMRDTRPDARFERSDRFSENDLILMWPKTRQTESSSSSSSSSSSAMDTSDSSSTSKQAGGKNGSSAAQLTPWTEAKTVLFGKLENRKESDDQRCELSPFVCGFVLTHFVVASDLRMHLICTISLTAFVFICPMNEVRAVANRADELS